MAVCPDPAAHPLGLTPDPHHPPSCQSVPSSSLSENYQTSLQCKSDKLCLCLETYQGFSTPSVENQGRFCLLRMIQGPKPQEVPPQVLGTSPRKLCAWMTYPPHPIMGARHQHRPHIGDTHPFVLPVQESHARAKVPGDRLSPAHTNVPLSCRGQGEGMPLPAPPSPGQIYTPSLYRPSHGSLWPFLESDLAHQHPRLVVFTILNFQRL